MASRSGSLVSIGNALVDIIANTTDDFLGSTNLERGGMTLVGMDESNSIYQSLAGAQEIPGGSAANTTAIAANLGIRASFIGKTSKDKLGNLFHEDMISQGVDMSAAPHCNEGTETGRCISLITPDAQRTMATYLGATANLNEQDIPEDVVSRADYIFLEGYLLDSPGGLNAVKKAIKLNPGKTAITLSDPKCVWRNRAKFMSILNHVDLIFCNENELGALYPALDFPRALWTAEQQHDSMVVCTHGPKGAFIRSDGGARYIPAKKTNVVDTTGAGDSFAGACLWGLMEGFDLKRSAEFGIIAASEVISNYGARPKRDLRPLLSQA